MQLTNAHTSAIATQQYWCANYWCAYMYIYTYVWYTVLRNVYIHMYIYTYVYILMCKLLIYTCFARVPNKWTICFSDRIRNKSDRIRNKSDRGLAWSDANTCIFAGFGKTLYPHYRCSTLDHLCRYSFMQVFIYAGIRLCRYSFRSK